MLTSNEQIKIKALVLSGFPVGTIPRIVTSIAEACIELNNISHDQEPFMQCAAEYILAYLDLGFSYLEHKELFDRVLTAAGYTEAELRALSKRNREFPLNKSRIEALLGRWARSSHNSHTKPQAVAEIMRLVEAMIPGHYQFYCARQEGDYCAMFVLHIEDDDAVIHDVVGNKFYRLVRRPRTSPFIIFKNNS